jgi:hypothetical protein
MDIKAELSALINVESVELIFGDTRIDNKTKNISNPIVTVKYFFISYFLYAQDR